MTSFLSIFFRKMEFPDLGKHCSETSCKQLDFLPVKCDACHKIFCNNHFRYDQHSCPESYRKDNQVPVCPLCNSPVSVPKGQAPDTVIGQHMDNDCQQKKKMSNKCNLKGCKQKELIPVVCDKCRKNYCIRHRLAEDHECKGFEGSGHGISSSGAAAASRAKQSSKSTGPFRNAGKPQQTSLVAVGRDLDRERRERQGQRAQGQRSQGSSQNLQAGLSEDEALARALALSMQESQPNSQQAQPGTQSDAQKLQEEQDLALAQALQASEEEARRNTRPQNASRQTSQGREKSSCQVS